MPDVEGAFRYRLPLQQDEAKPAFDGMDQRSKHGGDYDDTFYSTPTMMVRNARRAAEPPTIDGAGFALVNSPVAVTDWYDQEDMKENYHEQMKALVAGMLADSAEFGEPMFVMTNGHITRNEAEAEAGERLGSHHLVHNDFTPDFREKIAKITPMIDLFIENGGRVCTFNTWRRFDESAMRSPLAMCDSRSIAESDLIATSLANYGAAQPATLAEKGMRSSGSKSGSGLTAGIGQFDIFQASENPAHEWNYFPKMDRDEVLVFKTYDSHHPGASTFIPTMHTAFDDPQCTEDATPRESVECRVFCFIPPPDGFGLVAKAKLGLAMAKSRLMGRARL